MPALFRIQRREQLALAAQGERHDLVVDADARFAQREHRTAAIVAMDKAELHRLYPAITEQKHKYVEGALNLRAADPQGGPGVIVFELDPSGKATAWRVGVPPQVDYVEGCS